MRNFVKTLVRGLWEDNPAIMQVVGMCPLLAISSNALNSLSMGLMATAVLLCSNIFISLLRKFIPNEVRIPCFIVIIASFVTIVQLFLQAFLPDLNESLGLYIPLIVVNCIILARAESFAYKNNVGLSIADGIGSGLGWTIGITLLAIVREFIGAGTFFNHPVLPSGATTLLFILPPGAFLTFGMIIAVVNHRKGIRLAKKAAREKQMELEQKAA